MNAFEMNKKFQTKSIDDVITELKGQDIALMSDMGQAQVIDIDNCDARAKEKLIEKYKEFIKHYEKIITYETIVRYDTDKKKIPITYENVRDQILQFRVNDKKWLDQDIDKLPELLALIFSLWTLLDIENYQKQRENIEEEKKDDGEISLSQENKIDMNLKQPHAAQIIGIMRVLGVGYHPDEYQPLDGERAKYFCEDLSISLARIRNNLVQIKTGEGKSVTLAVLSIIFALYGFEVRCACYSEYLSERDFSGFKDIFDKLHLTEFI